MKLNRNILAAKVVALILWTWIVAYFVANYFGA